VNAHHAVRLLDELGTKPSVFYIYGLEAQIR
jgi:hypothetical protein